MERMGQLGSIGGIDGLAGPASNLPPVPLADGARFEDRIFANEAGSRPYKLYVPSGYIGQALPLVVMLHGCTQSADDFAAGTRMNELAEEQTFLVAYPAQTKSANSSKCWNWFNTSHQQRDRGEPSLIAGITRQIMRDFPGRGRADLHRRHVCWGCCRSDYGIAITRIFMRPVGVHSGLACGAARDVPSAFAAMRQGGPDGAIGSRPRAGFRGAVPTIVFHGDRDTTVDPVNGDQVIAQAKATGISGPPSVTARRRPGSGTPGPFRRMRAGDRCWSNGYFMMPATRGPAGALPDRTPSLAGRTPLAR